ncbi:MAG: arylsulfatase, partial [Planctomycetes bacterium]|nr:arylsulfatase [Planctomycetota bacterium]
FTDAHTPSALCCPTRYGLMTGRYPWRRGQTTWATPGAPLLIEPNVPALPAALHAAGYRTGCVGKWHLGLGTPQQRVDFNQEITSGPLDVGFDYFFGDAANRFGLYIENRRALGCDPANPFRIVDGRLQGGNRADLMKNEENARVLTERAVGFIEQHAAQPFFLYFAPNNVHTPLTPNARFKNASQCGVYGDFIAELDWSVGEVLSALDRLKVADNTLVVFTSDNGGRYEAEALKAGHRCNGPFSGQKGDVWEGGHRVPFLARWPGRIKAGAESPALACLTDLMATLAAAANAPLPKGAGPDSLNLLPVLTGETTASPRDTLVMQTGPAPVRSMRVFASSRFDLQGRTDDLWAIRQGRWKLIFGQGAGITTSPARAGKFYGLAELGHRHSDYTPDGQLKPDAPPGQLYDLAADPAETTNLHAQQPELVGRLTEVFERVKQRERASP